MLGDGATAAGAGGWNKVSLKGELNGFKRGMMPLRKDLLEDIRELIQHSLGLEIKFTITVPGNLIDCCIYFKMLVLIEMTPARCVPWVVLQVVRGGGVILVGAGCVETFGIEASVGELFLFCQGVLRWGELLFKYL